MGLWIDIYIYIYIYGNALSVTVIVVRNVISDPSVMCMEKEVIVKKNVYKWAKKS